jgi:hypothetical protein
LCVEAAENDICLYYRDSCSIAPGSKSPYTQEAMLTKDEVEQLGQLLDQRLDRKFDQKLKPIKKNLRAVKKTVDVMARLLDSEQMRQRKRIDKIEDHVGLPHPE